MGLLDLTNQDWDALELKLGLLLPAEGITMMDLKTIRDFVWREKHNKRIYPTGWVENNFRRILDRIFQVPFNQIPRMLSIDNKIEQALFLFRLEVGK